MSDYRLLAIDIDGTLVNSRNELTGPTRAALIRAGESGIHLVLATGRRYSRTLPLVEPLAIEVPLIAASGALIKNPIDHHTLYRAEFEDGLLSQTLELIQSHGFDPVVCGDTHGQGFDFYAARLEVSSPELAEYFRLNPGGGRVVTDLISNPPPGVFTGFTMGTRQQMLDLERVLNARLPGRLSTHVLRSPRYVGFMCEFSPAGVTKWSAVRRLATDWGIKDDEICAVGDDVNDIPMIRAAGLGIAMGNALPDVKAAADRIAPGHNDDGLVTVVEWLVGGIR